MFVGRVIVSLLGNAFKSTIHGFVKVTLSAEYIPNACWHITIAVEESGIGIPDRADLETFGAFSQLYSSSKQAHGGFDLGLAILEKSAEIMNRGISYAIELGLRSATKIVCPFEVEVERAKRLFEPHTLYFVSRVTSKKRAFYDLIDY